MLDLARGVARDARAVAAGRWEERARYQGDELGGLTLGIVGFGSIGKRVAQLAEAFGMRVIVAAHAGRAGLSLPELLAEADIVSLHVPLTPATRGMIGAAELSRMKRGARMGATSRA